jgi:hypothetical protein
MLGFGQTLMTSDPAPPVGSVFVPTLYTGNAASRTITSGIDLTSAGVSPLGTGGMVWIKGRSGATGHRLFDTVRGATFALESSATTASTTLATSLTAFGSSGFDLGADSTVNTNTATYVAWSFRRARKFFDVVTWTGDGSGARTIPHSLGVAPGLLFVKITSAASSWSGYHIALGTSWVIRLDTTALRGATTFWPTTPAGSSFQVSTTFNTAAATYMAVLFAHDTGADGIVQCGGYTGNGSTTGPTITLGWEPQYLLIKNATATGNWPAFDTTRGIAAAGAADAIVLANTTGAETSADRLSTLSTGFQPTSTDADVNASGETYIYLAIRKP